MSMKKRDGMIPTGKILIVHQSSLEAQQQSHQVTNQEETGEGID
jgi:hypothetical protein